MDGSRPPPQLSVFFPNYNHGQLIGQSIQSVLDQTYHDFELIIIDDGSTDKSWDIIQEFAAKDNRIVAEKFPQNRGVTAALERCLVLCRGEYLFARASDDYLINNNFFQQAIDAFEHYPDAAGAFGGSEVIDGNTGKRVAVMGYRQDAQMAGHPYTFIPKERAQKEFLFDGLFIPGASSIWKRTLAEKAGRYDDALGAQSDYFLNHLLPMLSGVVEIHSLVAAVRAYPESYSANIDDESFFVRHALVEKKLRKLIPNPLPEEGWQNWRKGIITSRLPEPETSKIEPAGQRGIGFAWRKYLGINIIWHAFGGSPLEKRLRKRRKAQALFENIVWGKDIL